MGTLAAALEGGCRLVIEPFGNDQFLNAKLTMLQGRAWAVHPHRFNPEQVAALLAQAPAAPIRAIPQGTGDQSPGGIDRAVELLSRFC